MIHPQFNPVAFSLFNKLSVHWYGLMYLCAFISFMLLCRIQIKKNFIAAQGFTNKHVDDILFAGALGVILGGRLGYALFYKFDYYSHHLNQIAYLWQGGMSFHGGFLGVVIALTVWAKLNKIPVLKLADFVSPSIPLGLFFGRIGNFINGELWGRSTDPTAWWAMVFPQAGDVIARHPSQLYQAFLEGLLLLFITWRFAKNNKQSLYHGQTTGLFVGGYGVVRFIVEFFREPDSHLGLLNLGLSMGQWLSIPMVIIGTFLYIRPLLKTPKK